MKVAILHDRESQLVAGPLAPTTLGWGGLQVSSRREICSAQVGTRILLGAHNVSLCAPAELLNRPTSDRHILLPRVHPPSSSYFQDMTIRREGVTCRMLVLRQRQHILTSTEM
eukprot:5480302-Amphidinium_carterae.1